MPLRIDATAVFLVHKGASEVDDTVYGGIRGIGHDAPMPQFFYTYVDALQMTPATRIVLHDLDLDRLLVIIQEYMSLSRLWYAVPPTIGGTTDGQYTVHRWAGSPHGVHGFDQLDTR